MIAQSLLHDRGFVAPAYPPVSITDPSAARAVVGTGLLLTIYCLIALGIGTVLRHSGATIATGIGLLFLPLLFLGAFPERISKRIEQLTPLAGMAIQSTTDRMLSPFDGRGGMPIGPWQGLGVAFAWALGALAFGYVLLRVRDATYGARRSRSQAAPSAFVAHAVVEPVVSVLPELVGLRLDAEAAPVRR